MTFTTTLTRTVTQPAVYELPFGPGDIVHWPAAGDMYHCYHVVESVYMRSQQPFAKMWMAHDVRRENPDSTWTNPVKEFRDVRVVRSDRQRSGSHGFAPYKFEHGTVEVVESFDVEHKFAVGDVIKGAGNGLYEWLVTGVVLEDDRPVYQLACQDGSNFETTSPITEDDRWALVGGPRFEAEQARKMTALQALRGARDLISSPDSWIKESYTDHDGKFCSVGAIEEAGAAGPRAAREGAVKALANVIKPRGSHAEGAVIDWNDNAERTHEQVLATFDVAIAQLALQEVTS